MDPILFGSDTEEHIISVHQSSDSSVTIFSRNDNTISSREERFYPFFHLSDKRFIDRFPKQHWLKKLSGNNFYQYVCAFPSINICWEAINHVLTNVNREFRSNIMSFTDTEHLLFRSDMSTQYLLQSGKTLFKGMEFNDIHRMQLDIETYSSNYKFSKAERSGDRIILISISDNRGFEAVLGGKHVSEKSLLEECIRIVREKDPDIIEGHNIFNFDFPYLMKRCELLGLEFSIGRNGTAPKGFRSRSVFAESELDYTGYDVFGRHIIDTWLLVEAYDVGKRTMESHGLKYAARYFNVSAKDRTFITGDKISWHWDNDVETLKKYALDDVIETRAISEKLSGSTFSLTKMLPYNFGTIARLGSSAKIESLLLREYLRQRHSIPKPQKSKQISGGYTDIYHTGVYGPIIHADVESLYPSIIIAKRIKPLTDDLNVFHSCIDHLTSQRLSAKKMMLESQDEHERRSLDALQSSYKILINSFYGYLGYSKALFNDFDAADNITTTGQSLLKKLIDEIERHNGTVIEVDTDGIFFIPPDNIRGESAERLFVDNLSSILPPGITLTMSDRYKKIFSYRKKNYALLHYDQRITIRGSSLISRSMEKFGRNYLRQSIECMLNNRIDELHTLYVELEKSLLEHQLDIGDLARSETLKESVQQYSKDIANQKRNKAAAYEVALASNRTYRVGDKVQYYITGHDAHVKGFEHAKDIREWDANFPDENTAYYLRRLREFSKKFEMFFSEKDFSAIFSSEGLFAFDGSSITILNLPAEKEVQEETSESESRIELDFDDF